MEIIYLWLEYDVDISTLLPARRKKKKQFFVEDNFICLAGNKVEMSTSYSNHEYIISIWR